MSMNQKHNAEALRRLAEALYEDVLQAPDEEIAAELALLDRDSASAEARTRNAILSALREAGDPDLQAAASGHAGGGLGAALGAGAQWIRELWRGHLRSFEPLPMTAEGVLDDKRNAPRNYAGVEVPLVRLLDPAILSGELAWARGALRLLFARSRDGKIQSVQATIGRVRTPTPDNPVFVLELTDPTGGRVILRLSAEHPSAVASGVSLAGEPSELLLGIGLCPPGGSSPQ